MGPRANHSLEPAPEARAGTGSTGERVLEAALSEFSSRGYDATSLDALAGELGVTKQTILYWFPSKEALLDAVIDRAAMELGAVLEGAVTGAAPGWARIETVVRAVFRVALRRPELLGLLRELNRLGPPHTNRLVHALEPLVGPAVAWLESEMDEGRLRRHDARLLLLLAYSAVVGVATEEEVLRAVGIEPTLRSLAVRRRELLRFLRAALVPDGAVLPAVSYDRLRPPR